MKKKRGREEGRIRFLILLHTLGWKGDGGGNK